MPPMGRFLFSCLFLIVWNNPNKIDCIGNFVGFSRHETLNKTTCPADAVIQNTHLNNGMMCFFLCSNQPSCRGLLFEPVGKQCVTCSVEMPMFYNRKEIPKFQISQYKLIKDAMSWEISQNSVKLDNKDPILKTYIPSTKIYVMGVYCSYLRIIQQKCRSLGGDLLSIKSKEENEFIVTNVIQNVDMDIWISATGLGGQAATFRWSDGSVLSDGFTNWGKNEPGPFREDEKCVAIRSGDFTWNDSNCPKDFYCICEFR